MNNGHPPKTKETCCSSVYIHSLPQRSRAIERSYEMSSSQMFKGFYSIIMDKNNCKKWKKKHEYTGTVLKSSK